MPRPAPVLAMALTLLFADICDRSEISKTRRRANLLKRKVLSAGNIVQGKQGPGDRGEYTIELETKAKRRFLKMSQSRRRPLLRPSPR